MTTNLTVVFQPNSNGSSSGVAHQIDIVFVHGLNPRNDPRHSENTWSHESGIMWPRDILPNRIPYARIMIFTYNSNVAFDVSESGVRQHANSLLDLVHGIREETETTSLPLIFIGHSLGGLVIKQALVLAKQNDRVYSQLRNRTKAIVFFATPHRGGNGTTLGQIAVNASTFFSGNLRNDLVDTLRKDSKYLAQISADFAHQYEDYEFLSVVETKGLMKAPIRTIVVESASAIIGLPGFREQVLELDRDHRQICKFTEDPDFNRVARHLKRIAGLAIRNLAPLAPPQETAREVLDPVSANIDAATQQPPVDLIFVSTLDSTHREEFVGQSEMFQTLESFVQDHKVDCLLLEGMAGAGKSSIVYEFVSHFQRSFSIFWLSAESPETLQRSFNQCSFRLKPDTYASSVLENHQDIFRRWLSKKGNRKWIVVFDNAYVGLDFRSLVPPNQGKVIVTSRHMEVKMHSSLVIHHTPTLLPDEAAKLFLSRWKQLSNLGGPCKSIPSSLSPIVESLRDRPLAVVLAASCIASMPLDTARAHLQILYEEEISESGSLDPKTWKWFSHLLEELKPIELYVLTLLAMFDNTRISDKFLDILRAGSIGDQTAAMSREYKLSCRRLASLQLLQRRADPWTQYFCIPPAIQDCLVQYLNQHRDHTVNITGMGTSLLCAAFDNTKRNKLEDVRGFLDDILPHYRAFCLSLKRHSISPDDKLFRILANISVHCTDKGISEVQQRCRKQFWRTWLASNDFALPESLNAVDDHAQYIEPAILPTWILDRQDSIPTTAPVYQQVYNAVYDFFWKDLNQSVLLAAVGNSWHGIREEVFAFATDLPGAPHEDLMRDITNSIDKGGCSGLQAAVAQCVNNEDFETSMMSSGGHDTISDIAKLISDSLAGDSSHIFPQDISSTISSAWNWFYLTSFYTVSSAFGDILQGTVKAFVCNVVEPTMTSTAHPDSFESVVAFGLSTFAGPPFEERAKRIASGYWEVVGAMGVLFAAQVLNSLNFDLQKDGWHNAEASSNSQLSRAETLMTRTLELTREGIMHLQTRPASAWSLSVRRAMYWCLQAEACRNGWTSTSAHNYRNQDRWEESCILMEITEGHWPVV
ncbi:MAG: hypothetical protein M1839_004165 [Geoglossum umbratile]|nr:MAG: hypothetical protein M1839_004165 [Geoglossum umbratile]